VPAPGTRAQVRAQAPAGVQGQAGAKAVAAQPARRNVHVSPGVAADAVVHRFDDLAVDAQVAGPALVEYSGSTLFLPPGWTACFDAAGNARVDRASGAVPTGGALRVHGELA